MTISETPNRLGRFTLGPQVAASPIATVFALHGEPSHPGAVLKVFHHLSDPELYAVQQRTDVLRKASARRLVIPAEVDRVDGRAYLLRRAPVAVSLDRILFELRARRTYVPVEASLTLVTDLIETIAALHQQSDQAGNPLAHGELSPDHILVDVKGRAHILRAEAPAGIGSRAQSSDTSCCAALYFELANAGVQGEQSRSGAEDQLRAFFEPIFSRVMGQTERPVASQKLLDVIRKGWARTHCATAFGPLSKWARESGAVDAVDPDATAILTAGDQPRPITLSTGSRVTAITDVLSTEPVYEPTQEYSIVPGASQPQTSYPRQGTGSGRLEIEPWHLDQSIRRETSHPTSIERPPTHPPSAPQRPGTPPAGSGTLPGFSRPQPSNQGMPASPYRPESGVHFSQHPASASLPGADPALPIQRSQPTDSPPPPPPPPPDPDPLMTQETSPPATIPPSQPPGAVQLASIHLARRPVSHAPTSTPSSTVLLLDQLESYEPDRRRLGEILVTLGHTSLAAVDAALARKRQLGGRVGEILVGLNEITESALADALARQMGLTFYPEQALGDLQISSLLLANFPEAYAAAKRVLPLTVDHDGNRTRLLVADPTDRTTLIEARVLLAVQHAEIYVTARGPLEQHIRQLYAQLGPEVDDDSGDILLLCTPQEDLAAQLRSRLQAEGYRVKHASDGQIARDVLTTQTVTAMVTELALPRVDGYNLILSARSAEATADIPIFAISSRADDYHMSKALELGADDFMTLPLNIDFMVSKLRRAVKRQATPTAPQDGQGGEVSGSLREMSLSEIVQTLELGRKTAMVRMTDQGQVLGNIYFRKGAILAARTPDHDGDEAFYVLARLRDGHFDISYGAIDCEQNITATTTYLLLEAMRRLDENE